MTGAWHLLHRRGQENTQRLRRRQEALQTNTVMTSPKEGNGKAVLLGSVTNTPGEEKPLFQPFPSGAGLNSTGISPLQSWWSLLVTRNLFPEGHTSLCTHRSAFLGCLSSYLVAGETQMQRGSHMFYEFHVTESSGQSLDQEAGS